MVPTRPIERLETGIGGLDSILHGGLPKGRSTLLSGTSGSGKTVFAAQFIAEGIRRGQTGVFVTFEETPEDLRRNMLGFGWDIQAWEAEKKWIFVDASPRGKERSIVAGEYDFGALLSRVEHAVKSVGATRVAIDSLGAVFVSFQKTEIVRGELLRLTESLKELDVTSVITVERPFETGEVSKHGVEEFVSDNVIILRNPMEHEHRRRTVEILKVRGFDHAKGEYPFTVMKNRGIIAVPLAANELRQKSSEVRVSSGNIILDEMCGGGFFKDSVVLISGATGTGKTLMVTEFIAGGAARGEKSLLFAFEESRDQLYRNARGWGQDFDKLEAEGKLKVICNYPEVQGLEDHLVGMKDVIEEFKPDRVAIDSLSALERVSSRKSFREFVIGITSYVKHKEIIGLFTSTTEALIGSGSASEAQISTITDTIILLRYVEMFGEMQRGIVVLKMRGSRHQHAIRHASIDEGGMRIGKPFRNVSGVISGRPAYLDSAELEKLQRIISNDGEN